MAREDAPEMPSAPQPPQGPRAPREPSDDDDTPPPAKLFPRPKVKRSGIHTPLNASDRAMLRWLCSHYDQRSTDVVRNAIRLAYATARGDVITAREARETAQARELAAGMGVR